MTAKGKAPQGRAMRLNNQGATDRADKSLPLYTNSADFIQDTNKFEREVKHFRSVTPEPRTMVYGIAASVPNTAAALRRTGRYS